MKFRKKRRTKFILRITLLLLVLVSFSVGYAYLNKTLNIQGTTEISKTTWNVRFANIQVLDNNAIVETAPALADNATKVNFSINLDKPGDSYSFTVDVVNSGTVDAKLSSIALTDGLASKTNYLDYSLSYVDGISFTQGDLLKAGTTDTIKFTVTFKKDITKNDLESDDAILTLSLTQNYIQDDGTGTERQHIVKPTIPANRTVDTLQVGDEICLSTECFNFIRYDGNNIVMLSKYNLKVGEIYDSSWNLTGRYSSSDTGYGLQSSDAKGRVSGASTYNGIVAFSATNYWSSLGLTYPADVYDNTYKTEPDFTGSGFSTTGYSIAYYVEEYKKALEEMGATIESARLLTYSESHDSSIGCSGNSCPIGFITNTSFWHGSAICGTSLCFVQSNGYFNCGDAGDYNFGNNSYGFGRGYGARPIIVISKSEV